MYIDTHCHLNFPQFDDDRAMVIGNAKKAGVKQFIVPGVDLFSSKQAVELAKKNPRVIFPSLGIHPYEAANNQDIAELEKLLNLNPVIAIGECGLDYHLYKGEDASGKKQQQRILFETQLELALKYNLPVIMHCRDGTSNVPAAFDGGAFKDFFNILDSLPQIPRGVIHCFSGGLQELRFAQERKFFVGFDGNVTYSKQLELIVPQIPLSMILLETDSPYLTPIPHRGLRNEPKYIPLIAKQISTLQNVSVDQVALVTTANAKSLFNL